MADGTPVPGSVFIYAPNKIAPPFFIAAFAASGLIHLYQCFRYKSFKLTGYFVFCGLLFTVGFALREAGAFDYKNLDVYIASTIIIYTAPPILELANYHTLGRILYYIPYHTPIHPGRVWTTFSTLSAIVEALNAIGVSYTANTSLRSNLQDLGDILLKTSLVLQIVVISCFVYLAGTFHYRCSRGGVLAANVKKPLVALYISTALIFVRTIYRTVEHFGIENIDTSDPSFTLQDIDPILRYEWYFYVFEASVMLLNSVLWNQMHPRKYLPNSSKVYLAQDGRTEIAGPGWEDDRNWAITCLDPFGWWMKGGSRKTKQEPKFWENNGEGSDVGEDEGAPELLAGDVMTVLWSSGGHLDYRIRVLETIVQK
ncbi:uncharacterized protein MKZ38_009253 [Zalerion maritima]|uniref:Uncharacterized protein n=1 Tax=Zalerion maritima TaxID=339359 RepID=A0AAD5RTI2_9PEZI|nr:uncharacterized protein MKZ38_009253 [Zalerion maritima]